VARPYTTVPCSDAKRGQMLEAEAENVRPRSQFWPQGQPSLNAIVSGSLPDLHFKHCYVSEVLYLSCSMNEWMNEWKCEDFKCVWKPTESRLCLTHYVNKSSRWAASRSVEPFLQGSRTLPTKLLTNSSRRTEFELILALWNLWMSTGIRLQIYYLIAKYKYVYY